MNDILAKLISDVFNDFKKSVIFNLQILSDTDIQYLKKHVIYWVIWYTLYQFPNIHPM